VTVLGVSQDDARDSKDFMKEFGVTFPSLLDVECRWPASNAYGLTNVPTVFLIEPDGTVKVSSVGFSKKDLQQISAELARTSGKRPVDVFRAGETVPDFKPG
jgi:peroxiredoxin